MRIAFAGHCHGNVLAAAMGEIVPHATCESFLISPTQDGPAGLDFSAYDLVFTHANYIGRFDFRSHNTHLIPQIVFSGLHPDFLFIPDIAGPSGAEAHSRLVLGAYLNDLSQERAEALFNTYIYARCGYFEHYEQAKRLLLRNSLSVGYDLRTLWTEWEAMGGWLYVPYHPKAPALCLLAKLIAVKERLTGLDAHVPSLEADPLGGARWPIYPEIAKRHGFEGDLDFAAATNAGPMDLKRFIARSFEHYDTLERERLLERASNIAAFLASELGLALQPKR
jgi:hypothetical protein